MARGNRYTDQDKARFFAVLDSTRDPLDGYPNIRRAAKECGIPFETARSWVRDSSDSPRERLEGLGLVQDWSERIAEALEDVIQNMAGYMTPEKMEKATLRDLATSLSTLIDRRQMLKGKPTQITQDVSTEEVNAILARLTGSEDEIAQDRVQNLRFDPSNLENSPE